MSSGKKDILINKRFFDRLFHFLFFVHDTISSMKRFLFVPLICAFFLVPTPGVCYAQDTPYVVVEKDVWLLDADGERIFLLPETYYAPLVGIDETYYSVIFNGVSGKVPNAAVSVTGYHQEATGTAQTLHIAQQYSSFTALRLRPAPGASFTDDAPTVPIGEPFTYLGSYPTADGEWYYVCYGDAYGYVLADYCDKKIDVFPFVPTEKESETTEEKTEEEAKNDDLLKVLVIAGVAVTIIILLVVILIPKRGRKTRYYYES